MKTLLILTAVMGIAFGSACSTTTAPNENRTASGNTAALNTAAENSGTATKPVDEVPAAVKAAFAGAQSFTTQHKDLTDAQIASIEKDTSIKVTEKDHHSYLAFSTTSGSRTQIGAATVVKAAGKDVIIVYENKDGSPLIKEVRAEGLPTGFLSQFAGKGHDNDLLLGADIKVNGANEAQAKSVTEAIRVDVLAMQALYGSAHAH
ncbi:MAG: hypothetical protein ACR2M8_08560 [Pyrinomonadaceae bacterium]